MKVCTACGASFMAEGWKCPVCSSIPETINGYLSFSPEMAAGSEGFDADYFGRLAGVEESCFWFSSRNALIFWALQRYFARARNFLEIGCGTGFVISGIEKGFPHIQPYGSEIFIAGLEYAASRLTRTELFQMDARHIPFVDEFDVIGAFDVLEHVKDDEGVLQQMNQALRSGGGLVITVPQHPLLWSYYDEAACHCRRYTRRDLRAKVLHAGFAVEKMTSFVSLLLPLMTASRVFINRSSRVDPLSGLKPGPGANALMEKVLGVERRLIKKGISLPVGGSLLLIGRKL